MYYYGTIDKKEIDFILEFKNKVIAIEVKASSKVTKDELKTEFYKGIIIYTLLCFAHSVRITSLILGNLSLITFSIIISSVLS